MEAAAATVAWCEQRNHPWVTYNPWLNRTYCRCGHRIEDGEQPTDWKAKWEAFHSDEPYDDGDGSQS